MKKWIVPRRWLSKDFFFSVLIGLVCLGLAWMPDLFQSPYQQNVVRVKGRVVAVDNAAMQQFGMVKTGDQSLDRLFLAAVFIGASGAVMDLAIDVSASMAEVVSVREDLSLKELVLSGFTVGRAMTSTLVTVAPFTALMGGIVYLWKRTPAAHTELPTPVSFLQE